MKTPDKPNSPGQQEIEAHIKSCPDCSAETQALDEMIGNLERHRDAFCPEPWQLYEFIDTGEAPTGHVAMHLESCVKCREAVESYKEALSAEHPMPAPVMDAFRDYHSQKKSPSRSISEGANVLSKILTSIASVFNMPALALGAVAAAILAVVIVYPRGEELSPIGLSSVTWKPKLTLLGPSGDDVYRGFTAEELARMTPEERELAKRGILHRGAVHGNNQSTTSPSVAFVITFKGFKEHLPQGRIDKLYEALKPTKEMKQKFEVLAPAKIKEALGSEKPPANKKQLLEHLKTNLNLSKAVLITIEFKDNRFDINNELIDVQTGKILSTSSQEKITEPDLATKLRDSVFSIVLR